MGEWGGEGGARGAQGLERSRGVDGRWWHELAARPLRAPCLADLPGFLSACLPALPAPLSAVQHRLALVGHPGAGAPHSSEVPRPHAGGQRRRTKHLSW